MSDASEDIKKSSRGRPKVNTTPVMVRVDEWQLDRLDAWRRGQKDMPTRPEAMRRLVDMALDMPPE